MPALTHFAITTSKPADDGDGLTLETQQRKNNGALASLGNYRKGQTAKRGRVAQRHQFDVRCQPRFRIQHGTLQTYNDFIKWTQVAIPAPLEMGLNENPDHRESERKARSSASVVTG